MPNQKLSQGTTVKTGVKRYREASKSPQRHLQNRKKTSSQIHRKNDQEKKKERSKNMQYQAFTLTNNYSTLHNDRT